MALEQAENRPSISSQLHIRAIDPGEMEILASIRGRCYDATYAKQKRHHDYLLGEHWGDAAAGDFLIAERAGRAVGTITALRGVMSVRGVSLPCQGIAWVGTSHDARRSSRGRSEPGIATQLMHRTLAMARERGEVLTALAPFRASFYEHFGYGLVERRALWDIPLGLLPAGEAEGFELLDPGDAAGERAIADCRTRHLARGHGDMAFPGYDGLGGFAGVLRKYQENGYCFLRRRADGGASAFVLTEPKGERGDFGLACPYLGFDTPDDFTAILSFLGSLRDQYRRVLIETPADEPINLLLRETQVPHRGVEHVHARCEFTTRLQVRILDHLRFLSETPWPDPAARGQVVVGVRECEGTTSIFGFDVSEGRCQAKAATGEPDFTCADKTWAAIAMGDLKASTAAALGLATCTDHGKLPLLDTLSQGPLPFCREYF